MTPLAPFLCAAAFVPLIALQAHSAPTEVQLSCDQGLRAPICRALAAVLAQSVGPVILSEAPAEGRLALRFVPALQSHDSLSGHIVWQTPEGRTGEGATLTLSVLDASLNREMLDRFAVELLRHSNLPL